MPWVRLDDRFPENPKVARVGPLGLALWVTAIAYCNRNLTDGFVPRSVAHGLLEWTLEDENGVPWEIGISSPDNGAGFGTGHDVDAELVIAHLLSCGLLTKVSGGYLVHDYLDYQRSADQIRHETKQNAKRQGDFRKRRNGQSNAVSNGKVTPSVTGAPNPNPNKDQNRLSNSSDVDLLFSYWLTARKKSSRYKLTKDRAAKMRARLKEFTLEQLKQAVDGVALDPWEFRDANDDCGLIFRDAQHVDRFIAFAQGNGNGGAPATAKSRYAGERG